MFENGHIGTHSYIFTQMHEVKICEMLYFVLKKNTLPIGIYPWHSHVSMDQDSAYLLRK